MGFGNPGKAGKSNNEKHCADIKGVYLVSDQSKNKERYADDKLKMNQERHPLKQIGEPIDIAELAYYLITDKSKWVTGQNIVIDGGISSIKI